MWRYRHRSWWERLVLWFLTWLTFAFIGGVIFGTAAWFFGNLLGAEWEYFPALRTWIIGIAVVDLIIDLYKYGTDGVSP